MRSHPLPTVGGIDFGFHNPFAAVWGYVDGDDVLWILGVRYKSGTTLPVHSEALPKGVRWSCDPSGAESIAQLRQAGHEVYTCVHRPVRAASGEVKKPILAGIDMVTERIRTGRLKIVRQKCLPLVRELGLYHYDETKQSEEPVKEDDHACDALRYLVTMIDRMSYMNQEIDEQAEEHSRAEQQADEAERDRKQREQEDLRAQSDPFDPRWFHDA